MKYYICKQYKSNAMETKVIDNRKVICEIGCSFKYDSGVELTTSLHCHSEYELIYIMEGHGKEFVGDSVREYHTDDLVLIGANLPHLFLSDMPSSSESNNSCCILQFPRSLFPEQMESIQEYSQIYTVLENSTRGVCFHSKTLKRNVLQIMEGINKQRGIDRLTSLFKLLDMLGKSDNITFVSSLKYTNPLDRYILDDPISQIFSFLINNHRKELTLENIATHVHINATSICRFFKQRTGKTLFQCLNKIRVEHACKLLGNSNLTIAQVAWESGFRNQAHFNKQFRQITKLTPTEYVKNLNT